jgi:hypothetical protein
MGCGKVFRRPFHQNDIVIAAQRHNVIALPLDQQNVTRFQSVFWSSADARLGCSVQYPTRHNDTRRGNVFPLASGPTVTMSASPWLLSAFDCQHSSARRPLLRPHHRALDVMRMGRPPPPPATPFVSCSPQGHRQISTRNPSLAAYRTVRHAAPSRCVFWNSQKTPRQSPRPHEWSFPSM